jgi:hypothetical protein
MLRELESLMNEVSIRFANFGSRNAGQKRSQPIQNVLNSMVTNVGIMSYSCFFAVPSERVPLILNFK